MDPTFDANRPDPLTEPASPLKFLLAAAAAVVAIPLVAFYFNLTDALIRPLALAFGKPTTALVSSKRVSHARHSAGNYVELNYQYSPDYAPRPEIKVNAAAFDAIKKETNVAIHFIPGCSSCVALDEDYGSARGQMIEGMCIAGLAFLFGYLQYRKRLRRT